MGPQFKRFLIQAAVVGVVTYGVLFYATGLNLYVIWLMALGVATFMLYGFDKLEARRFGNQAKNRVPERLLHLLVLMGGFGGGWLGMFLFWHKVRDFWFWAILIVATALHVVWIAQFF